MDKMDETQKKKVDEDWKGQQDKEHKEKPAKQDEENFSFDQEPNFIFLVTSLAMQATIALGDAPNPINNKQEANLTQAKFFIDLLSVIKDKTNGNLNTEEDSFLERLIYELRMRYIEKSNKPNLNGGVK